MPVLLAENNYGKSRVRLVKVTRHPDRHDLKELTVHIQLEGDFATAHTAGDNSKILPTDTMKNTVYALAKDDPLDEIEEFGERLAGHFLKNNSQVSRVRVELDEHLWTRMTATAFLGGGSEKRVARITGTRETMTVESGIEDLTVLKTAGSAFGGFVHDRYTTLKETKDRMLATAIKVSWLYARPGPPFGPCRQAVRQVILDTFAGHDSQSVQHTLYAMGEAVLKAREEISEIRFSLPNKHCLLVDLKPFGLENPNEIFVPVDEPHGLIEATLRRAKGI